MMKNLAERIKLGCESVRQGDCKKYFVVAGQLNVTTDTIYVLSDGSFRAIVLGDTTDVKGCHGYMYVFYTSDDAVDFPSVEEVERRLCIIAKGELLQDTDSQYFDLPKYGSLEEQRKYFAEILNGKVELWQ